MRLTIIILNWNAAPDTIRAVQAVMTWQQLQPTVIVVDNASTDNSAAKIRAACPTAHVIANPTNQGFAGGNNRGLEHALNLGDAPILLLNNDAVIAEADANRLLTTLTENERLGFIGPLLFDADQRDRLLSAGSKDPARHHLSHNHQLPPGGPVHLVECVPGTVILIRAEIFRQLGLFDEAYFFGSEVADLCLRARQHGFLSAVDDRARAYHTLKRSSRFRESLYPYYIIRNRFLLIRKFHRRWKFFFYGFWALYSFALATKVQLTGQSPMARAVRLGLLDGLQGRFHGQNERVLAIATGSSGE
jgi:GT2 family glycosyltransferase